MNEAIFLRQRFALTLTARDNNGDIISLSGKTVHFLTRNPSKVETVDTSPIIANPANGQAEHIYAAGDLDELGPWMAKLLFDGEEVPSTRYIFVVTAKWAR